MTKNQNCEITLSENLLKQRPEKDTKDILIVISIHNKSMK
jgi:hypothetical protein